jgi:hypothetical protein
LRLRADAESLATLPTIRAFTQLAPGDVGELDKIHDLMDARPHIAYVTGNESARV